MCTQNKRLGADVTHIFLYRRKYEAHKRVILTSSVKSLDATKSFQRGSTHFTAGKLMQSDQLVGTVGWTFQTTNGELGWSDKKERNLLVVTLQ